MSLFERLTGTVSSFFQVGGPAGPRWKSDTGNLDARDAADANFVNVRGASPTAASDFVTLSYAGASPPLATGKTIWFSGQNTTLSAPTTSAGQTWGWNSFVSSGGVVSHVALAAGTRLSATNRVIYTATSSTTVTLGITDNGQLIAWRGNATGQGGFVFVARFAIEALGTTVPLKCFVGLEGVLGPPAATDWTTDTTISKIGMAFTATTSAGGTLAGNWQLVEGSTSARTIHDLGASFALTVNDYIEIRLSCTPDDTLVSYQITNLTSGAVASGTLNTTLPANTVFLVPYINLNIATGGAGTTRFSIAQMYLQCFDG